MQGRIQSPFENLRWTFLQKQLMTFSHQLFLQKAPSICLDPDYLFGIFGFSRTKRFATVLM